MALNETRQWRAACLIGTIFIVGYMLRSSSSSTSSSLKQSTSGMNLRPRLSRAIVFDAGSTGSRVHVYRFNNHGHGNLVLQDEVFEQLKPGLSSYKDDPTSAGRSLIPLLNKARESIPPDAHKETPVALKATAGLRMLPGNTAELILAESRKTISNYGFDLSSDPSSISIMDGDDEAKYAWVTVNYLLNTLSERYDKTVATIDIGGGSTQIAMAVANSGTVVAEALGHRHKLFVYSHLGYGLMAGRYAMLSVQQDAGSSKFACLQPGVTLSYRYAGKEEITAPGPPQGSTSSSIGDMCIHVAESVLKGAGSSFAKNPGPPIPNHMKVYLMSYAYDRAVGVGIISDSDSSPTLTINQFKVAAIKVCSTERRMLPILYPKVDDHDFDFLCMDLSFLYSLLIDGYGLSPNTVARLGKGIEYPTGSSKMIEVQWTLGMGLALA